MIESFQKLSKSVYEIMADMEKVNFDYSMKNLMTFLLFAKSDLSTRSNGYKPLPRRGHDALEEWNRNEKLFVSLDSAT